jgi:hypothetical protein
MLGSVGDEGGVTMSAVGSGVELRTSVLIEDEGNVSREELGITHCNLEVFLNM